MTSDEAEKY